MTACKILSYNVGSSSSLSGLLQLLQEYKPLIVMLQEVVISTEQLNFLLGNLYIGECNNDVESQNKPGTAFVWSKHLEIEVVNLVP